MIYRCTSPDDKAWKNYGGRGISVCEQWLTSFDNYYAHVGDAPPGLTLDRIDNDGNYEPGNMRWATPHQQTFNQRHACRLATTCRQGHPYDDANTYVTPLGKRDCRTCRTEASRRARSRVSAS